MSVQLKVRQELSSVTQIVKRSRDTEEQFRKRMIYSSVSFTETQWSHLSTEAQIWVNEAITATNKRSKLPLFPGEEEILTARRKSSAKSAANRENNLWIKGRGGGVRVKEIILDHGFNVGIQEIARILKLEGYKYSIHTIHVVRAEFKRALKMLWDRGMLTGKPKGM